jgi:hypothetical protein
MTERAVIWYSSLQSSLWESAPIERVWQYNASNSPTSGENGRVMAPSSSQAR